jgi:probable HAF family extracellular repeat protein
LTPVPNGCFRFIGWTGACQGTAACTLDRSGTAIAEFTTVPDGDVWNATRAVASVEGEIPIRLAGYDVTEITYPQGTVVLRSLDDDGNAFGAVVDTCGYRPMRYDARTNVVEILTPLPEDDAAALAGSASTVVVSDVGGHRSYRWNAERLQVLGSSGAEWTTATGINAKGWIVGYSYPSSLGGIRAFLDDGAAMRDLGAGFAYAVNDAGAVVGMDGRSAALFVGTTSFALPPPPVAKALDVSETGLVVGTAGQESHEQKRPPLAFLYDLSSGALTMISPLPGDVAVSLDRVNRAGTLAVGRSWRPGQARDVLWREGVLEDLTPLVHARRTLASFGVIDVNDRGQLAVMARAEGELVRAYVLTPR